MGNKQEIDLAKIKMLIMDVDGVLTDGTIIINADGTESKRFSLRDGHGIKMWHRAGLKSAIISGRSSEATIVRAQQLSIEHVLQGCKKKLPAFESFLAKVGLNAVEVAYIGDDHLDLPIVRRAGLGVAVADAAAELKQIADFVTKAAGGGGAVREVIEHILKNTGRWESLLERYLV